MSMTLEQVRDRLRELPGLDRVDTIDIHEMADAIDAHLAQPRAVPKLDAEDWAVLQRLRNALPDVGLNGWHRGVTVLSKLLAAAPSPGEPE